MNTGAYLVLSAIIFSIGVLGFLIRRNALVAFMSIEMMLNATNLAFGGKVGGGSIGWVDGATYAGGQWQNFMKAVAPDYDTSTFSKPPSSVLSTKK